MPVPFSLLVFLPFLGRLPFRSPADRPLAIAVGATGLAAVLYLTVMGLVDYRPYGATVVVPDRKLTPVELRGLKVWVDRHCAYCHNILGRGGRSVGPDLSNVVTKGRTKDRIANSIRDPKAVSRWTIMPKYSLTGDELNALTAFILSLDFDRYGSKTLRRKDFIITWKTWSSGPGQRQMALP